MAERPKIGPGDWIRLGGEGQVRAVVCTVFQDTTMGDCEVVYLDDRNRAINEDARWNGTRWEFAAKGPTGGYADNYPRLSRYVDILRAEMEPRQKKRRG